MARMALLVATAAALAAVAPEGARGAFGHAKVAEHFDAAMSKHFLSSTKKSYALRKSRKENKPLMVMLTRRGCGACQNLKQSFNLATGEDTVQKLAAAGDFLVVHAEGSQGDEWQRPYQ